eukprot:TRINITY_DN49202_c0_g1_i1.p1 TRINITY_DN49202_c0_g1~~TRINITY_DN49202_c0_g1_i1.p1  ORF type:complete len:197 (+),score=41.93 TRINITY_DN49202_c0_g1_i1:21-611(+)
MGALDAHASFDARCFSSAAADAIRCHARAQPLNWHMLRAAFLPLLCFALIRQIDGRAVLESVAPARALMRHAALAGAAGAEDEGAGDMLTGSPTNCENSDESLNFTKCEGETAKCREADGEGISDCLACPKEVTCKQSTRRCNCYAANATECDSHNDCKGLEKWCIKASGQGKRRCATCGNDYKCHEEKCQCKDAD